MYMLDLYTIVLINSFHTVSFATTLHPTISGTLLYPLLLSAKAHTSFFTRVKQASMLDNNWISLLHPCRWEEN